MVWMQVQQLRMHCHHMSATAENRVLIGVYCWVEERANQHHLCLIVGDAVTAKRRRRRRNLHKKETQACMENGQMHSPIFACLLALGIHWPLILLRALLFFNITAVKKGLRELFLNWPQMQGLFQIEWLIKNCMFLLNNALQSIYWGYLNSKQIINQLSVLRPIVLQFNLVWIQCPNYQLISRMYYDAIFLNHNNSNQQLTSKSDPFYLFPAVLL